MGKYEDDNKLNIYYGIPHCHSSFSTGEGKPYDIFDYGRRKGLDFIIITDHNNYLCEEVTTKSSKTPKWGNLLKYCEKYNKKHKNFLGLCGFEAKLGSYGHINVINNKTFFKGTVKRIENLLVWLWFNPSILSINHPHSSMESLSFNPTLNEYITLIEVGNGTGSKYSRFEKRYYRFLDKGWKLGAINSQDNHKMNFGDYNNLTAVVSETLSTENLMEAFKNRKTYSTESPSLKLKFTIDDIFMGDTLTLKDKEIKFNIRATDSENPIEKLYIISSKGKIIKEISFPGLNKINYLVKHNVDILENWYVIKIVQENNKIAISSPIFINKE
ncbi:CehA/McbA family metallohydrolase [Clostridium hydrogeniformans]|uniref:CehA/McbA family metallohydrolase n=1 Tax=Clostridium hydrogeniformans TaxID=349933 RepID=UPI00048719C7|nr:CehA/McbA family metallohydrolase [Clostridium hydrogeniformans]